MYITKSGVHTLTLQTVKYILCTLYNTNNGIHNTFMYISKNKIHTIYPMNLRLGVIQRHVLKSINHEWFTYLVTLCYDVHYNVCTFGKSQQMAKKEKQFNNPAQMRHLYMTVSRMVRQ